jgi:hypothetical protein
VVVHRGPGHGGRIGGRQRPRVVPAGDRLVGRSRLPRCGFAPQLGRTAKRLGAVRADDVTTARVPTRAPLGIPPWEDAPGLDGDEQVPPMGRFSPASPAVAWRPCSTTRSITQPVGTVGAAGAKVVDPGTLVGG